MFSVYHWKKIKYIHNMDSMRIAKEGLPKELEKCGKRYAVLYLYIKP